MKELRCSYCREAIKDKNYYYFYDRRNFIGIVKKSDRFKTILSVGLNYDKKFCSLDCFIKSIEEKIKEFKEVQNVL